MKHNLIYLCLLLLGIGFCGGFQSLNSDSVRDGLRTLSHVLPKLGKLQARAGKPRDISIECGLCGLVVNEIEGFMIENTTISDMEYYLDQHFCSYFYYDLNTECRAMVGIIPDIVNSIEAQFGVSGTCMKLGFCQKPFTDEPDNVTMPHYTVDLDLPPAQRWKEICSNSTSQSILQYIVNTVTGFISPLDTEIAKLGRLLNDKYFPTEYAQEIVGCAQYAGIDYGWLSILNIGYELSDACTAMVAQTEDNKIYHARNLDFWEGMGFTASLRDVVSTITWTRGGKVEYHTTSFAGFIGALSGMRPGGFSVTVNTRFYPEGPGQLFYEVVAAITEKNASLVAFLSRDVLAREHDFEAALGALTNTHLIADVYYTVAGLQSDEGAVISRNRLNASDVWRLQTPDRWYLVETNYDHWKQPPWFDNRVTPAVSGMNSLGRSRLTLPGMYNVMSVKPILSLETVYTLLAVPQDGTYTCLKRWCKYPCTEG